MAKRSVETVPEQLMTLREVADLARVSTRTISRMVERGELPVVQIGRCPRFRPSDVREALRPS